MTTPTKHATAVLIPGHWLGAWAWDEVREHLTAMGERARAITLPGLEATDPDRATRTLADQVAAIEHAISEAAAADGAPVMIVAHSGANVPVTLVLDRHPELVFRVVWVDSGPVSSGSAFAADLPKNVADLPLPPFETLAQQASLAGLNPEALARFRALAVPEPGPVLREPVQLTNDARYKVPTTLVCCSIPSAQLMELARSGHPMFAEVVRLEQLDLVDLPTGHWPMWSRPGDLAEIIAAAQSRSAS